MEFVTWTTLATCAGALTMVLVITQLIKGIGFLKKVPTQLLSYILALLALHPAYLFTGQLNATNAVLILFNGVIVVLAANGGFAAIKRSFQNLLK